MGEGFIIKCIGCGSGASGVVLTAEVKRAKGFFSKKRFYVRLSCNNCGNSVAVPIKKLPKEILI